MGNDTSRTIYIFDTDELTNLRNRDDLGLVWDGFVSMIKDDRLKTIRQVFCELEKFQPVLKAYKPLKPTMCLNAMRQYAPSVTSKMVAVESACPKLIDFLARGPCDPADPWLVALGAAYGYTVITAEKKRGSGFKSSISFACKQLNVNCKNLNEFLEENGLP